MASSPRPTCKVYFEQDELKSDDARDRYDSRSVTFFIQYRDPYYFLENMSHFTYSDSLHIIVAVFQSQPLSLEFLAMKKVLELGLEVKDLPQRLQVKAEKVDRQGRLDIRSEFLVQGFFTSSDQILPFINEEGRKTLKKLKRKFGLPDEEDEESDEESDDEIY